MERHRLAVWEARGWLPDGVAPSLIAAAYRRRFGVDPRRDQNCRTFRAYSLRELDLGLAFETDPLQRIWRQALQRLELPSTKFLLAQQAHLKELREGQSGTLRAVVDVSGHWMAMVQTRSRLLSDALAGALGQPVELLLRSVEL